MRWRSTRARPSSTAASPRGSTAWCSASWSTARRKRFYDEGEDTWPKRYAIWGRLIAQQPEQIAYSIVDAKSIRLFMPSIFPAVEAGSIGELAVKLTLDPAALEKTVDEFNAAVRPGTFDHTVLDDCATQGLTPPKSHWARALDTPPYYAYPLRPGITFTYLGVRVNEEARIVLSGGAADRQHVRRRRDHGRQRAGQGLSRRHRHDHRRGVRPHRRAGGRRACPQLTF